MSESTSNQIIGGQRIKKTERTNETSSGTNYNSLYFLPALPSLRPLEGLIELTQRSSGALNLLPGALLR